MQRAPGAQRIYSALSPLGLRPQDVTSVISGPHVPGSAHFDGRAIDVGSIAGQAVGFNRATWNFVIEAIQRGGLSRIGTIAAIVNNPQMRAFAAQHGVDLFEDEGTGPHLHLQVGR
jgi:hypothetical protein